VKETQQRTLASKEFRPSTSTHVDTKDTAAHITTFPNIINATNQNSTEKPQLHMKHFGVHEQTDVSAWQRGKRRAEKVQNETNLQR